jgi:hypothetical protein
MPGTKVRAIPTTRRILCLWNDVARRTGSDLSKFRFDQRDEWDYSWLRPTNRINRRCLHFATPDFLWRLVASANCMRLSSRKGAHAALSSAAWQEIRVRSVEKHFQEWSVELQIPRLRSELVTFLIWLVVRGRKAWKSICQRASPGSFDFAHKPSVIR